MITPEIIKPMMPGMFSLFNRMGERRMIKRINENINTGFERGNSNSWRKFSRNSVIFYRLVHVLILINIPIPSPRSAFSQSRTNRFGKCELPKLQKISQRENREIELQQTPEINPVGESGKYRTSPNRPRLPSVRPVGDHRFFRQNIPTKKVF